MRRCWYKRIKVPVHYGIMLIGVILIVSALYYGHYVINESETGMKLSQIAPAIAEKSLYPGSDISIPFECNCQSADRFMVNITITANAYNNGYMTLGIRGTKEKTFRTGVFRKIAGTYLIPLYCEKGFSCHRTGILHITLSGGDPNKPLIYIAKMLKNKRSVYQVEINPEKGYHVTMPKDAVFPRSVTAYKKSGDCILN